MAGWIKLHRKIMDNAIFTNAEAFHLFTFCILAANHKSKEIIWNGQVIKVERGSFITGRKTIATRLNQHESTVYRNLKLLEKLGLIKIKSNNKYTVINVVSYGSYQDEKNASEQQVNNRRTTGEQQVNTNKNEKNYKNEKKESKHMSVSSNSYSKEFEEFWKSYPRQVGKKNAWKQFQLCLKGEKGRTKATAEQLIRSANSYKVEQAQEGTEQKFIKHPATFLGISDFWTEYDKPVLIGGRLLRTDVDIADFQIIGGCSPDMRGYERARRGLDPYTRGQPQPTIQEINEFKARQKLEEEEQIKANKNREWGAVCGN